MPDIHSGYHKIVPYDVPRSLPAVNVKFTIEGLQCRYLKGSLRMYNIYKIAEHWTCSNFFMYYLLGLHWHAADFLYKFLRSFQWMGLAKIHAVCSEISVAKISATNLPHANHFIGIKETVYNRNPYTLPFRICWVNKRKFFIHYSTCSQSQNVCIM